MKVPISWLKQYVPVTMAPKDLAHRLTMNGIEVDSVEEIGATWDRDKLVVGHVLAVEPHPNADRLRLPTVDLGNGETVKVVCGGPNLAVGQKIVFAREGAMLLSNKTNKVEPLKASTIRGVVSAGMVCSERELGLAEESPGIMVLDPEAPIGVPVKDYLGDVVMEAAVTPNRPDCLSILGIAREVAAFSGQKVTEPNRDYPATGLAISGEVKVVIDDASLCSRYAAGLITDVKVGPSPKWLVDVLEKAGQRSINNVVDVTNYVMLEHGQPLHAFDLSKVKDKTVVVRPARSGEKFTTLDGVERTLKPPMLVIADSKDAIALAGVMGGKDSGVTEQTAAIILESASFHPINTRKTAAALGLRTDASYRFERGVRAEMVPLALARAMKLILEVAGGQAAKGVIDVYPGRREPAMHRLSMDKIRRVLGVDYSAEHVERVLTSLGFEVGVRPVGKSDVLHLKPPYWRADINIEEDIVEEVARVTGYDTVPTKMLSTPIPQHVGRPDRDLRERVKDLMVAAGLQEVVTYPTTDMETLRKVGAMNGGPEPVKIFNPMSKDQAYMRTSLRGSVLGALAGNRRVSQREGLRLFEIGRVYIPKAEAKERDLPDEREMLVGVLSGPRFSTSWRATEQNMDFYDGKGVLEAVFESLKAQATFEPATDAITHPGKTARVLLKGKPVGILGELHPSMLDQLDLGQLPVTMFEIDMSELFVAVKGSRDIFSGLSRFPEADRDMAIIVDVAVPAAKIQAIIDRHKLVKRSAPFDVYTGKGVPDGKKSIAFRIVFQSEIATLTSDLVDKTVAGLLRQLQKELGAELRG
ncbi:MAG: phenylalanine--tRNA ligase subunit beta [SAR202 cluster bacterium]|nr:phenylalanine--tRNA ligase subunit beta [SAR202 cluster bacterium]